MVLLPLVAQDSPDTQFRHKTNCLFFVLMMSDESELLDKMPLVMRTAIAVDINLTTFQKIDLFKVQTHQST